jgi:hypothetical protein
MQRPALDAPASEWLVYADALQVAGDPRGELITLVHHGDEQALDTHIHNHAPALLGPAAKAFRNNTYRLTWRHCFIETADVRLRADDHGAAEVHAILSSPASAELRELALVGVTESRKPVNLSHAVTAMIGTALPPHCRSLAFVDERATRSQMQITRHAGSDPNLVRFGSLAKIWKLPIDSLRFEVGDTTRIDFGTVDATRLRRLVLRSLRLLDADEQPSDLVEGLIRTSWPVLEELELRLAETFFAGFAIERNPYVPVYDQLDARRAARYQNEAEESDNNGVDYASLEPLFAKLARAPLRRLALTSFDSADSLFEVLGRTGLPPTLRVLDLSDSTLHERHVAWMRTNAKLFASLTHLILERTSLEDARGLEGLGPTIVHSHEPLAPTYRYVVGME